GGRPLTRRWRPGRSSYRGYGRVPGAAAGGPAVPALRDPGRAGAPARRGSAGRGRGGAARAGRVRARTVLRGGVGELGPVQLLVAAVRGQQFLVAALFDDAPLLDHQDPVGGADGGEPVRDDDGGAPAQRLGQRLLHRGLGGGVQAGGGLVQDHQAGGGQ